MFTPTQEERYEFYRRSSFPKPIVKKVMQTVVEDPTMITQKMAIVMAGITKIFVGELTEYGSYFIFLIHSFIYFIYNLQLKL